MRAPRAYDKSLWLVRVGQIIASDWLGRHKAGAVDWVLTCY